MESEREIVRLVLATILFAVGGFVTFANWFGTLTVKPGRSYSQVPLIGGGCLALGAIILPATRPFAWVGLLVDPGTFVVFIGLPMLVRECWRTSKFNLLEKYVAKSEAKTVALMLYRRSVFVIVQSVRRSTKEYPVTQIGVQGNWERRGDGLLLRTANGNACFQESNGVLRQSDGFAHFESDEEFSLAGLEFQQRFRRPTRGRTHTTSAS